MAEKHPNFVMVWGTFNRKAARGGLYFLPNGESMRELRFVQILKDYTTVPFVNHCSMIYTFLLVLSDSVFCPCILWHIQAPNSLIHVPSLYIGNNMTNNGDPNQNYIQIYIKCGTKDETVKREFSM